MKVICAIDDSPYSQDVLKAVCKRKWPADCQFKILTVIEPLAQVNQKDLLNVPEDVLAKRKQAALSLCQRARRKLEEMHPDVHVHFEIREGQPKAEIVSAATEWSSDKILLGAHSRGACPHFLAGSVSQAVAAHAPCSLEIIRPKLHKCA
jgi:nucleotide-binding universal stress UspA family protein